VSFLIADTGPLVALLNQKESSHVWSVQALADFDGVLLTCEPVLTEALFLLDKTYAGTDALWDMLNRDLLVIAFELKQELRTVQKLKAAYRNVPMSLADACLVRMSELYPGISLFTLDTDFQIYRKNKNECIPCLAPWN
jgi:predicted nucleic acid-binding protein